MAQFERKSVEFEDFGKFLIQSKNFSRQFCGIYQARLASLKAKVSDRAKLKWNNRTILSIVDLTKDEYKEYPCIVIGTLYKYQELKPSILKEIANELQAVPQPPRLHYCSPKDMLFLEDDVARIKLVGDLPLNALVTGLVCAIYGQGLNDGSFLVKDFCFPGPSLKPLTQLPSTSTNDHDWIIGFLGNESIQEEAANIVRVIIAGNSVRGSSEIFTRKGYFQNKKKDCQFAAEIHQAIYKLDCFLSKITKSCSVILLPGEFDPSCYVIPQHPFHPKILPTASKGGNLYGATNPWIGKIGSRIIGGSSGQPILDIMKLSNIEDSPLSCLEKTLEWQHFAPTAPDTLSEYPFDKSDPLIMNEYPNIYFVGNMEKYETKLVQGIDGIDDSEGRPIRLICIPKFSTSHTAVLVNLESLHTQSISFGSA
ncbi:PREDICTED: DNA polymerase delta subunit 2-like isoform X2 [Ceratosolen solmsi marchali]|uniref:DNA polymerase delta subunit 2-like isoform X2 n=1 Tax=Ceratosolen solmsi marchali TaxID=326594 RepID=A0AAJ6YH85_9HYME|nr:PREDICTED: DNA polymerase delta subunit 2-like isoform X2 [Ceratosolen solmsi marchali]